MMGYRALYRKYRPQRFADIVGQQHITQTLQNAITSGRVSHAYLFCGPRGTGKTTTAKLLAKTLNCVDAPVKEPCNHCENCIDTTAGTSVDVIEIDAASNRGIDNIRDLREKVKYSPAKGRYRIYIIDEVHMLTLEAFNALLKTLEEPPGHVIFVLATTEPHKVPVTILSRCQRFDFRRISMQDMVTRLRQVADDAGLQVEQQALVLIASAAEGGLRDALSILDQGAVYGNNKITVEDVHNLLGIVGWQTLNNMASYLANKDAASALQLINELFQQGKDLHLFVKELGAYLRKLMLYLVSNNLPEESDQNIAPEAKKFTPYQLATFLETLAKLEYDMKWSGQPRVLLELAVVKMTAHPAETPNKPTPKWKDAEQYLPQPETTDKLIMPATPLEHQQGDKTPQTVPSDVDMQQTWHEVLEKIKKQKPSLYGVLREAKIVGTAGKSFTIGFKPQHSSFHKVMAEQTENVALMEQVLSETQGKEWKISITTLNKEKKSTEVKNYNDHPLVQKAIEMFGQDKVVINNCSKNEKD